MASSTYDEALRRLLVHEGGYSNHPSDPGGPTNFGITLADYRKYVEPDATADDVRDMSVDEAKAIYRKRYWDAQRCDELPCGVDYSVFDYGVNSGIGRSGKVLRRVVGLPDNTSAVTAHSDDADQLFQRIPISHSDRSRSVWCSVSAPLDAFLISVFSPGVKHGGGRPRSQQEGPARDAEYPHG